MRIVPGPLLRVGENLVGGLDLREPARGSVDIVDIAIGVKLEGFPAI